MERRSFLKCAAALGAVFAAGGSDFMTRPAAATGRTARGVFEATGEDEVISILFPGMKAEQSRSIRLAAPYLTTPREAIAVGVGCNSEQAQAIAITATNSRHPLVAFAVFHLAASGFRTRMCLDRTSSVSGYVLTASGLFMSSRVVKVTRGGYGTNAD